MFKQRHIHHLLHCALLLLVLSGAGHIHNHVCLDGQEPPALVHFENLGGHPDHDDADEEHADIENELMPEVLLTKVPDQDSPLFLISATLLPDQAPLLSRSPQLTFDAPDLYPSPSALLPPLRAPPHHSS